LFLGQKQGVPDLGQAQGDNQNPDTKEIHVAVLLQQFRVPFNRKEATSNMKSVEATLHHPHMLETTQPNQGIFNRTFIKAAALWHPHVLGSQVGLLQQSILRRTLCNREVQPTCSSVAM